jgi:hypothetical protein
MRTFCFPCCKGLLGGYQSLITLNIDTSDSVKTESYSAGIKERMINNSIAIV